MSGKSDDYESLLNFVYQQRWPIISRFMSESLERFMGEKRIGIFGDYTEKGNGWSKMEYLARELAHYDYSVLTGKTLFKRVGDGIAEIPFLLAHVASLLI